VTVPTYLIAAHADPTQLARLCSRLSPGSRTFIHVDAKVRPRAFAEFRAAVHAARPAAVFLESRRRVTWSGFEGILAHLDLARAAVSEMDASDHLVLLSGADYPIRPVEEFERFLDSASHRQHIRAFAINEGGDKYRRQIERYWWMDQVIPSTSVDKIYRRLLNESLGRVLGRVRKQPHVVCQGLTWWAITADCARHVLGVVDHSPQLTRYYRHVWCPDEKLVHSIVHSSGFARQTRYGSVEPFRGPGQWRMTNFHLIHPSLVKYYTIEDREEIAMSEQYFVRKVATGTSAELLDWIDRVRLGVRTS
jgi:hypothetical protein